MLTHSFTPFPVLKTKRLLLRQISDIDAPEIFFLRSDNEVMKYLDRRPLTALQEAHDLIQKIETSRLNNDGITWAITLQGNNKLIGTIGFWRIEKENYRSEIGYMLHPEWQRNGLMNEAIAKVLEYGFSEMKLHSVEADTNVDNQASQRLLERLGFIREAYFRENYFYNGKFIDSAIYSILTPHP